MKKLVFGLLFLLLAGIAVAHEGELDTEPGVTADSFLWGLDRALENIKLLLTFDRAERIRIGLSIAEERLAEAHELKEAGKSSHDTLSQYAVSVNRLRRQLEKYGATEAKELVLDVDDTLIVLKDALSDFETQEDVETANAQLAETVSERKSSLGIGVDDSAEKIVAMVTPSVDELLDNELIEVIPVNSTEDVEDSEPIAIKVAINAETDGNVTHIAITGDITKTFDLTELGLVNVTKALAEELGLTEDEVSSALTLKDSNALKIVARIEGNEITRITVKQNGKEQKITLAVIDEATVIKEVAKRAKLDIALVESTIVFVIDDEKFYIKLAE